MMQAKTKFLEKLNCYFDSLPFSIIGKTVCICLSGGADSVSLLFGIINIAKERSFEVCACHFNHMIRGDEADRDEEFCNKLCKDLGIKLYCGRDDVPAFARLNKMSLEEAARACRYAFFERISSKSNIDFCATAHNMNDNAETLLFNLLRGSGSNGASAIAPYDNYIIRPMLNISRLEVEEFLSGISQEYIIDSTNYSNDYTRNYIRNVIFPELKKINPSFIDAFSRYIEAARCDREYFDRIVAEKINFDLRNEHKSIRYRVYIKKLKDSFGCSLNSEQLGQIDHALFLNKRVVLNLFDGIDVIVENGNITFYKQNVCGNFFFDPVPLNKEINNIFNEKVTVILKECNDFKKFNNLSTTALLSSDNIVGELFARSRRQGDRIRIFGVNKSLKKLFIEKGIPKEYRDIIPVICDSEGIIYVPFVGISDRVFTKNDATLCVKTVFHSIETERWVKAYEK